MNEFKMSAGEVFKGPSKTLTDAHFLMFSAVTGDTHPVHYDAEYARHTQFKKPIAHGLLLASLVALGASNARERLNGLVMAEQGTTFLKPVVVGDTISPQITFEKEWSEGKRRFCRFITELFNQNDECVLRGFHVYRILQRPGVRSE